MSELSLTPFGLNDKDMSADDKTQDDINHELKRAIKERDQANHEIKNLEKKQAAQLGNYISKYFGIDKSRDSQGNLHIHGIIFNVKIVNGMTEKYELVPAANGNAYIVTLTKDDAQTVENSHNSKNISNMCNSKLVLPIGTHQDLDSFDNSNRDAPIIPHIKILNLKKDSTSNSTTSKSSEMDMSDSDDQSDKRDNESEASSENASDSIRSSDLDSF